MSTMKKLATSTAGAAALALGALVAAAGPAYAQEGASSVPTTLTVENTRGVPVTVYLERGAFDTRLGTVQPHSREVLGLPVRFEDGDEISLTVHPEGGPDLTTPDGLVVRRGQGLVLYVPLSNEGWVAPPPPETIPNPGFEGATLTVENPSQRAVVAFIERGAFDTRIGTVPAGESKTFELPATLTEGEASIDIFLHVEGSTDLDSTTFELGPDAHLLVKVPT